MTSKMHTAIDGNNRSITIAMTECHDYAKPLRCEFCDALVDFVSGHTRSLDDKIVHIKSFFRLKRKYKHQDSCCYNVKKQVVIIARESEGDILAALNADKFELRLLAVKKAMEELQELANQKQKSCNNPERASNSSQVRYVTAKTRLGSYINTAKRVLLARTFCEKNSEMEELVELVFGDVHVPWKNFYYEDGEYFRCFTNVNKATVKIPIAIQGIIKSNKVIDTRNGKWALVNLIPQYRKTDRGNSTDVVCVSVWSHDLDFFNLYKEGMEILAFGMWSSRKKTNENISSKIRLYRNFSITAGIKYIYAQHTLGHSGDF